MTIVLENAPVSQPVDLADAKAHLRIDSDDEDDLVISLIAAATQKLDGRDGLLGRCLITQTWQMKFDRFPDEIAIPLPPCQSIGSIAYVDTNGATQTLSSDAYQVTGVETADGARIVRAYGKCWPTTRAMREAVTVMFTAGYGDDADDVPEPIRTAIKEHVALLYGNRESVLVGDGSLVALELPQGATDLIRDYRTFAF